MKTKITKLDNKGRGIAFINDKITFINNALEDEEVEIDELTQEKKYNEANAKEILVSNNNRVMPKCPYYDKCGGCNIMHMNYEHQIEFKLNKVKDIIKKYAEIDYPIRIVQNNSELFYRNKISLKIEEYKWGYFNASTHNFVEVEACLLAKTPINEVIKKKDQFQIKNGSIVIRTNYLNEILISITTDDKYQIDYDNLPDNIVGIVINDETKYKNNYFYDTIGNLKYKVSYDAFFQVNNFITQNIFIILSNNLKGEKLLDLYCGVGTLGQGLKDNFNEIYGIEINENAILDARQNASINDIKNAKYFAGDTYKILKNINKSFDTIIVDPPRSGLNKGTLDLILSLEAKTIAYISCDPMTLARDLKILKKDYNITKINALDMFPNTYHVETVCVLERK